MTFISSQYPSKSTLRLGIYAIDVQENFAHPGWGREDFGRIFASDFQRAILGQQVFNVVELFDVANWQGKREEFFGGNYKALDQARSAGYDMVLVGKLDAMKKAGEMVLYTKLIDTHSHITVWSGESRINSTARTSRKLSGQLGFANERPELFNIEELKAEAVRCTVAKIFEANPVVDNTPDHIRRKKYFQ